MRCIKLIAFLFLILSTLAISHANERGRVATGENSTAILPLPDELEEGDSLRIELVRLSGNLEAVLAIRNEDGDILASTDNPFVGRGALEYEIEEDGAYIIEVAGINRTVGDFIIRILLNDEALVTNTIASEESVLLVGISRSFRGILNQANPVDDYYIFLKEGSTLVVEMTRLEGEISPTITLLNAEKRSLEYSEDTDDLARLTYEIPEDAWYIISAASFGAQSASSSGRYTLRIQENS
jgi:hypothetical protein